MTLIRYSYTIGKKQQILEQRSVGSALSQRDAMTRLSQLKRLLL